MWPSSANNQGHDKIKQKKRGLLMEVQFTGTGAVRSNNLSASALINKEILIDVPNGIIKAMRNKELDPKGINICLITHLHGDHYFDTPFLLMENGINYSRKKPLHILGPKNIEKYIRDLFILANKGLYNKVFSNAMPCFIDVSREIGKEIKLLDYRIEPLLVEHGTIEAYGFLIHYKDKTIGYSGDTRLCESVEKIVKRSDIAILDMSFKEKREDHMGHQDIEYLIQKYPDKKLFATHLSDESRRKPPRNIAIPKDFEKIVL